MDDKKAYIFPALLFAIFFILITITGYVQIRIIRNGMEGLLKSEGEIFFKHIRREIDINLEYLSLLEKSPSIITPNFLNIMIYDEAIVEELYNLITGMKEAGLEKLPLKNAAILDRQGNMVAKKGTIRLSSSSLKKLASGKEDSFIRMPSGKEHSLFMGLRLKDQTMIFSLDDEELDGLRKRFIVKEIIDREDKRFNITGIRIIDPSGEPYVAVNGKEGDTLTFSRALDSKYLPGYTMAILISREPANNVFRSSMVSFMAILLFLLITGTLGVFGIFILERKHDKKTKELERELAKGERLVSLGKLASGMAHEIRNPLNAISMSVQRLKREFLPEEAKKEEYYRFVDIIRGELQRVNRIVEDFLLSTKAQAPFLKENLHTLVEEVLIVLKERAASKGVELVNGINPAMEVTCQKERIKQVFFNIVLNAVEASLEGTRVEVSALTGAKGTEIEVKDQGTGIDKNKLETIFEYYYTTKDKGMGLGLPISFMIVKDHGGSLKVKSAEGQGTTFTITLPAGESK